MERRRLKRQQEIIEAALVLLQEIPLRSIKMEALYKYFGSRQGFETIKNRAWIQRVDATPLFRKV